MRIGLLIYGSLETVSGGYLYDRLFVDFLRRHGHTVEIVSLPWRTYWHHLLDNRSSALLAQLRKLQVDLLLQDELNHPSLAFLNRRLKNYVKYPIISIVHHLRISEDHPALLKPLYRWVETHYLNSVDGFIFNSQTTQTSVTQLVGAVKPAIVTYPGATHLSISNSFLLHENSITKQSAFPFQLLFIGNLIARKGLHTVLDGLSQMSDRRWHLHVVGSLTVDPHYAKRIQTQITKVGLGKQVTLHGRVDSQALQERLSQAHLLVVPSYEGFGIVYLEAMAYGLPVIASTAGAAHEIVSEGVNGFLVEVDAATVIAAHITHLQHDRQRWLAMSSAARQRFDSHPSWEKSFAEAERWLIMRL